MSDPTANAFCGDPPQCLEFYACVKETKEETCTYVLVQLSQDKKKI